MSLNAGTRLGPYEILSAAGAGGMGEVYRARDTRLDRTVAIKILPDHLADRADLRERFDREARTIAGLNHVRPYPGPGGKWQISTEGGTEPAWNPKGHELFFRNGQKMMAVDYSLQPTFSPGKPRMVFQGTYTPSPRSATDYDISSDGQRFLMLKGAEQLPDQISVVLNWTAELKQKSPAGKK